MYLKECICITHWPSAEPGVEGIASSLKGQEWPQGHRTVGNCDDKLCLHYGWDRAFTSKRLWEQVLANYLGDSPFLKVTQAPEKDLPALN